MSRRTTIAVSLAIAGLLLGLGTSCKEPEQESTDDQSENSIAAQVAAGSGESAEKESKGSGAADIDHGGVTSIPDDPKLAEKGKNLFNEKGCGACHAAGKRKVGPPLEGVTDRREAAWIARMIQHPEQMLKKDPTAKKLLKKYGTRMANQNVSPEETRALIAYLATLE
jgi:cytochrome c2